MRHEMRSIPRTACAVALTTIAAQHTHAQSAAAVRFFGTGTNQQDRIRIPIDDNAPGPDASTPCDVGAASFTIDFWVKGTIADNPTTNAGGDISCNCFNWIDGNVLVDRDIFGASERDWGISVIGGVIRFGVGRGDAGGWVDNTIEGSTSILNNQWNHVACVRDFAAGQLRIYINGTLDFAGPTNRNRADISYPNNGDPAPVTPWGPFIVLAAEKHDADPPNYPSFRGVMDEFRVWNRALSPAEIASVRGLVVPPTSPMAAGLVGLYRLEEAAGNIAADTAAAGSPDGQLIAGTTGNGEWVPFVVGGGATAPVVWSCPGDFNNDNAVNTPDLTILLGVFGQSVGPWRAGDVTGDGAVNTHDLTQFLGRFGQPCP
ncbi:MAG: LamG-like jellyroll fold domain-containing protein [Phycisphaerales bacterium]